MEIAGCKIQNNKILENTENDFVAFYKKHCISITSNHGHGKPKDSNLKRFDISVTYKDGTYAVDTWEDYGGIEEAIEYALKGALLTPSSEYKQT